MSEYSFEKKSVIILIFSLFLLLILVYLLGLLTGLGMDRSDAGTTTQLTAVKSSEQPIQDPEVSDATSVRSQKSELSIETEPKPVAPDFKEVSPQADQPLISQPKKE